MKCFPLLLSYLMLIACLPSATRGEESVARWWKGNLHTHSLWSDGDEFPEMIADWYRSHGYHFLALSDHNVLSQGMRYMSAKQIISRSDDGVIDRYRKRFGDAWVETRGNEGTDEFSVRLKPLDEFRYLVEGRGEFIMIPAEEISDRAEGKPVHINASNIGQVLEPTGGATVREVMQHNLRAILAHEQEQGREVLPHLNHPNFHYAITAEDLAHVISEQFFEVYNGHPGVNHAGDEQHIGVEQIWDIVNVIRLTSLNAPPIFGIATDDSHEYHGKAGPRPGRGWVMVRAKYLTPEHLIRAMKQGDVYASSGVILDDVKYDAPEKRLSIVITKQASETYHTDFVGVSKSDVANSNQASKEPIRARIFASDTSLTPSYSLTGDELYLRAVVTSSLDHHDPSFTDQKQQAWTQPVGWKSK